MPSEVVYIVGAKPSLPRHGIAHEIEFPRWIWWKSSKEPATKLPIAIAIFVIEYVPICLLFALIPRTTILCQTHPRILLIVSLAIVTIGTFKPRQPHAGEFLVWNRLLTNLSSEGMQYTHFC